MEYGLMYHPQQLQQCSSPFIIEFMNWYFMWFFRACVELCLFVGIHAQEAVQTVCTHYLQNTQDFGWPGITVFWMTGAIQLPSLFSK